MCDPGEVDWVVVDRLIEGEPVEATPDERAAAVHALADAGRTASQIMRVLGMSGSRVKKILDNGG
jgi:predicted transcriptional regulator